MTDYTSDRILICDQTTIPRFYYLNGSLHFIAYFERGPLEFHITSRLSNLLPTIYFFRKWTESVIFCPFSETTYLIQGCRGSGVFGHDTGRTQKLHTDGAKAETRTLVPEAGSKVITAAPPHSYRIYMTFFIIFKAKF